MKMFKALASFLIVFVAATNAQQHVNSGSKNTAMNVMSSGSSVVQNDVQNVDDGAGLGFRRGYGGYLGYPGYAGHPGYYGYDAPIAYGHGYGYAAGAVAPHHYGLAAPAVAPHHLAAPAVGYDVAAPHHYGGLGLHYGYGDHVMSASSNTGANIHSANSDVFQHHIQNVNKY